MCFVGGHSSLNLFIFVDYFQTVILNPERPRYLTDTLMASDVLCTLPPRIYQQPFSPEATDPGPLKHWVLITNLPLGQWKT